MIFQFYYVECLQPYKAALPISVLILKYSTLKLLVWKKKYIVETNTVILNHPVEDWVYGFLRLCL